MTEIIKAPFFVYGTLRVGEYNYKRVIEGLVKVDEVRPAVAVGSLYSVNDNFPALLKAPIQNGGIKGDLLFINPADFEKAMARMDKLEGYSPNRPEVQNMYLRKLQWVYDEEKGALIDAYVYFWNYGLDGLHQIESGDWKSYYRNVQARRQLLR